MTLEIIAAGLGLLAALRKTKKVSGVGQTRLWNDRIPIVNDETDGHYMFEVGIWQGSGYLVDLFVAFADSEEEALEYVVAYIEQNNIQRLFADNFAEGLLSEGEDEELLDMYVMYVDATMVGADRPHYILTENLRVRKL